jgi:hypothetical protein
MQINPPLHTLRKINMLAKVQGIYFVEITSNIIWVQNFPVYTSSMIAYILPHYGIAAALPRDIIQARPLLKASLSTWSRSLKVT